MALPVQNPNPLGAALALLLGAGAAALTAWQQAVVAAVFELCLVGVMVIYELLGHVRQPLQVPTEPISKIYVKQAPDTPCGALLPAISHEPQPKPVKPSLRRRSRRASLPIAKWTSVMSFAGERLIAAEGERTEIKSVMQEYRVWCAQRGLTPMELGQLLDEIEKVCRKLDIEIEVGDNRRVYCLNVKLANTSMDGLTAVH
jgi:hypothetical protein